MNERVRFITHQGRQILQIDWSNATAEQILEAIVEAKKVIASQRARSVLTLTIVTEAKVSPAVTMELKEYVAHNKPYVLAGAVVGINDLKMIIFNFVNRVTGRALRAMDSVEAAKAWLVSVKPAG